MYKVIDFKTYDRLDHFNHFMTMENPFINITVDVDITNWIQKVKNEKRPFFLSFLYMKLAKLQTVLKNYVNEFLMERLLNLILVVQVILYHYQMVHIDTVMFKQI